MRVTRSMASSEQLLPSSASNRPLDQPSSHTPTLPVPHLLPKPRYHEIYDFIQRLHDGKESVKYGDHKFAVVVRRRDWPSLENELFEPGVESENLNRHTAGWAGDKVYYNYDDRTRSLTIKMRGYALYCRVTGGLRSRLCGKLASVKKDVELGVSILDPDHRTLTCSIIDDLEFVGREQTYIRPQSLRTPCIAFNYAHKNLPGFVIEISHGHMDLRRAAHDYIARRKGNTKTFVGIEFEHRTPKQQRVLREQPHWATYQVFRFRVKDKNLAVIDVGTRVKFRDANGVISPNAKIPFSVADFVADSAQPDTVDLHALQLDFTHQELHDIFSYAEKYSRIVDEYSDKMRSERRQEYEYAELGDADSDSNTSDSKDVGTDGNNKDEGDSDILSHVDENLSEHGSPSATIATSPAPARGSPPLKKRRRDGPGNIHIGEIRKS
ncbi:uncharacterized protein J4E79_011134 [Alternaria viburni]|uniref:uncharacterized protein n=1 Tax=Alternaria viburni TaxID=566460 RepID=UPI0020C441CD|nr:uncharacterized protein J4E79_011134 [Alternaria viburni]KAI4644186.1 hypothetical protein J4E79_011134 [Alternaria viburni]